KSLCLTCQELQLSRDRFIIQSRRFGPTIPTSFRLLSTTNPIRIGSMKDLVDRSVECSLCRLVIQSVQRGNGDRSLELQELQFALCTLNWEVDGREVFGTQGHSPGPPENESPRGLTRRLHVRWNHSDLRDCYIVYVAPEARITSSDAERMWDPSLLFLGRQIGERGNIQARVKSWIDLCQNKHHGPCFSPDGHMPKRFRKMTSHAYFGVVDVLNMQLTELPQSGYRKYEGSNPPYVALSYVWGDTPSYTTVLDNVMQHRAHGGLGQVLHELPKVIRDAIDLVRRLGFQYLWVDALCIIQNNPKSWELNAYNMDLIYGNAVFTICAADGFSASTGLLAMDEKTGTGSEDQMIVECAEDVRLVVSRPPEMYIRSSRWNTRAWTFQERLLSRRCLIFTGNRVFFQCQSTGMSEDIYADREGAGWSLDFMDAPLQIFRQIPIRAIWVYTKIVELYTARELSKQEDILAAFSGVSNSMQETMQAPFTWGLPTSHLDFALLWSHNQPVQRRVVFDQATARESHHFPSWSWSGWVGAAAQYQRDTVHDCLDNMNEWLEERTWIRWYIRDDVGNLRPLWDGAQWKMDLSKHEKWQGYSYSRSS
ncbi:HET-domain-containing protein, partial [Setomelanomma holmii]